jgi:stress response protein SCP2
MLAAMVTAAAPVCLSKGGNIGLADLGAGLDSVTVMMDIGTIGGRLVEVDVSAFPLDGSGIVRSDADLVFYNQPSAFAGAIQLHDRASSSGQDGGEPVSQEAVTIRLDELPETVARIVLCASVDPAWGVTFGAAESLRMVVSRSGGGEELLVFPITDASSESALLFGEFYRRAGNWRLRAVGQGYEYGLAAVVTAFGVDVAAEDETEPSLEEPTETREHVAGPVSSEETAGVAVRTEASAAGMEQLRVANHASPVAGTEPDAADDADADEDTTTPEVPSRVSVRRATHPPAMPAGWEQGGAASEDSDWQVARLFPTAGIGSGTEQERRATSSLLAVMSTVREFGRTLVKRCGGPAGKIEAFLEVPFGQGEQAYRPDGLIRATRGSRVWTALVEVKTAHDTLNRSQIEAYLDIAHKKEFDAVITISNQLTGAGDDHPVSIDRKKLKKVALYHLPWDEIRTEAKLLTDHHGVTEATQRHVLTEFVRYLDHPRSGLDGFTDMGQHWVKVREAVKTKTLRPTDRGGSDVSAHFDQLVAYLGLHLSSLLGTRARPVVPRESADSVTRCQQLADSGVLFGSLRIPGAVNPLVIQADLRAERVSCSIRIDAPREGRTQTKINWLLRQLSTARDAVRVEALVSGRRGETTAGLLGALRKAPEHLLPRDDRDIRAFTLDLDIPMGSKRGTGKGSLIGTIVTVTDTFYAEVAQHLRSAKA